MGGRTDLPPERALRNSPQVEVKEFSQDQYDLKEQERPLKCVIFCPHVTLQWPTIRNKRPLHHFTNMKYRPRIVHYLCDKSSSACQKKLSVCWVQDLGRKNKIPCELSRSVFVSHVEWYTYMTAKSERNCSLSGEKWRGPLLPSGICLYFTPHLRIYADKYEGKVQLGWYCVICFGSPALALRGLRAWLDNVFLGKQKCRP